MDIMCWLRLQQYTILKKSWKIDKTSRRPAVDLAYKIHGPSPSGSSKNIIALHGLLGSKRNWDSMCKMINSATNASVVAADIRNHGDSPHNSTHTYPELASDVSQLITKLSMNKAHIIGHSMGGRTGMVLALSEPSKVASLVVADISPVSTAGILNDFFPKLIDVMKSVNFQGSDTLGKARTAAKTTILSSGLIDSPEGAAFIIMNVGQLADKSYGWKCNLDALKQNFVTIATFPPDYNGKQYPGPTLFIGGGRSNYLPKTDEPGIKSYFPQAELQYIPHVGHNVHAEDPTAFLNILKDFFSKNL
ncbi:sn-1-specific diacylglycerol lipase ABHD11-like [Anticarsia gemmatalis]|uniref:sn-1-specific diacylglycerol lipase ABHD11-like n=1 Tax=Anticarsia gemmatalis TaxID=129554 RepID=UPI003F7670A7